MRTYAEAWTAACAAGSPEFMDLLSKNVGPGNRQRCLDAVTDEEAEQALLAAHTLGGSLGFQQALWDAVDRRERIAGEMPKTSSRR